MTRRSGASVVAELVGALSLARAVADPDQSVRILKVSQGRREACVFGLSDIKVEKWQ